MSVFSLGNLLNGACQFTFSRVEYFRLIAKCKPNTVRTLLWLLLINQLDNCQLECPISDQIFCIVRDYIIFTNTV